MRWRGTATRTINIVQVPASSRGTRASTHCLLPPDPTRMRPRVRATPTGQQLFEGLKADHHRRPPPMEVFSRVRPSLVKVKQIWGCSCSTCWRVQFRSLTLRVFSSGLPHSSADGEAGARGCGQRLVMVGRRCRQQALWGVLFRRPRYGTCLTTYELEGTGYELAVVHTVTSYPGLATTKNRLTHQSTRHQLAAGRLSPLLAQALEHDLPEQLEGAL